MCTLTLRFHISPPHVGSLFYMRGFVCTLAAHLCHITHMLNICDEMFHVPFLTSFKSSLTLKTYFSRATCKGESTKTERLQQTHGRTPHTRGVGLHDYTITRTNEAYSSILYLKFPRLVQDVSIPSWEMWPFLTFSNMWYTDNIT